MIKLPTNLVRSHFFAMWLLFVSTLVVYFPILDGHFKTIYDSDHIVDNQLIHDEHNISQVFTRDLFNPDAPYRPLVLLSHMAQERLFGLDAFYFYLLNILLHAGSVVMVYAIAMTLAKDRLLGILIAFVFGFHPAHWEAVSFLSGRAVLLNAFLNLMAFYACLRYMRRLSSGWLTISLVFFSCALLSHEAYSAVTVIFLFYVIWMAVHQPKNVRLFASLPYGVVALVYILIRHGSQGFRLTLPDNLMTLAEAIINIIKVLFVQLGILVAPFKIHFHQTADAWQGFNDPRIIFILALLVLVSALLAVIRTDKKALVVFLLVWYIAGLWPLLVKAFLAGNNLAVPIDGTMSYMASVALIAFFFIVGQRVVLILPKGRWLSIVIVGIVLLGFGFLTFKRNILTVDEIGYLAESRRYKPNSAILEYQIGLVYAQMKINTLAQRHFERALALDANFTSASMGLAKSLYDQGKLNEAAKVYETIRNPDRYQDVLQRNLRVIYASLVADKEQEVVKDPNNIQAYFNLGIYYDKLGDIHKSIAAFEEVIIRDPQDQSGYTGHALKFQGLIFNRLGELAKAQDNFQRAEDLTAPFYEF